MIIKIIHQSENAWSRFHKTQKRWMANCVMGPDDLPVYYLKFQKLGFEILISQVFTSQQYRSQALNDNVKKEITPSNAIDDTKQAIFQLMEKLNLKYSDSAEFIKAVGDHMLAIDD